jgi:flagellar biosynthesis/type III secretory pathway protein FliH
MIIDDDSYGLGYDAGFQDGRDQGYNDGWQDAMVNYEEKIRHLHVQIETLEAELHALSRGN